MNHHAAHTWEVQKNASLSVCSHIDESGRVGLSLIECGFPSFQIRFLPDHLPKLRELVAELERRDEEILVRIKHDIFRVNKALYELMQPHPSYCQDS